MKKLNKKMLLIGGIAIVVAILIAVILFFALRTNEKKLTKKIEEYASIYYEEQFYPIGGTNDEERTEFVKQFSEKGIKVVLENLLTTISMRESENKSKEELVKEFVNSKTKKECDLFESYAYIFPTGDYKKTDYQIKVELSCGF